MLRSKPRKSRRASADPSQPRAGTDVTATPTVVSTKLRLAFNAPVSLSGIPQVTLSGGAHSGNALPTSATFITPVLLELDYAATVATGNVMTIPERDPAVRTGTAGYMTPQISTLA